MRKRGWNAPENQSGPLHYEQPNSIETPLSPASLSPRRRVLGRPVANAQPAVPLASANRSVSPLFDHLDDSDAMADACVGENCDLGFDECNELPLKRLRGSGVLLSDDAAFWEQGALLLQGLGFENHQQQGFGFIDDSAHIPVLPDHGDSDVCMERGIGAAEDSNRPGQGARGGRQQLMLVQQLVRERQEQLQVSRSSYSASATNQTNFQPGALTTPSPIRILIKTLSGWSFELVVDELAHVSTIKEHVCAKANIPPEQQRLIWNGKLLADDCPLHHCGLGDGDTVHLMLALRGGGAVGGRVVA